MSDPRSVGDRTPTGAAVRTVFAGLWPAAAVVKGPRTPDRATQAARRRHDVLGTLVALGVVLLLATPRAQADTLTAQRLFERDLDIWFGTLTVVGGPAFSGDFVELDDRIAQGLRLSIQQDLFVDVRVRTELTNNDSWVNPGQTDIDWVLGQNPPPANLPAQQNLLDAYAATAAALFGSGTLTPGAASSAGMAPYLLTSIETTEPGPVAAGTEANPVTVGSEGDTVIVTNEFAGIVHYFNRDAAWTLTPTRVPEPETLWLLALGIAALAVRPGRQA